MSTTADDPRMHRPAAPGGDAHARSLPGLFSDLWRETTTLVRDEAELAKADLGEKVSQAVNGARAMAMGGAVLFAGFIVLLLAAANGLAMFLDPELAPWLAPLIVGAVVMVIGLIALSAGRRKVDAESLKPTRTTASLRSDRDLLKEHTR